MHKSVWPNSISALCKDLKSFWALNSNNVGYIWQNCKELIITCCWIRVSGSLGTFQCLANKERRTPTSSTWPRWPCPRCKSQNSSCFRGSSSAFVTAVIRVVIKYLYPTRGYGAPVGCQGHKGSRLEVADLTRMVGVHIHTNTYKYFIKFYIQYSKILQYLLLKVKVIFLMMDFVMDSGSSSV